MRLRVAAAALALVGAGCATTKSAGPAIGDVDEEGCVLTARVALAPQPEHPLVDPADASASSGREQAIERSRWSGGGGVVPAADKIVRGDLYVDYYTCPKITIPEKSKD